MSEVTYEVTLRARGRLRQPDGGRVEADITVPATVTGTGLGASDRTAAIRAVQPLFEGVFLPALQEAAGGELRVSITAARL